MVAVAPRSVAHYTRRSYTYYRPRSGTYGPESCPGLFGGTTSKHILISSRSPANSFGRQRFPRLRSLDLPQDMVSETLFTNVLALHNTEKLHLEEVTLRTDHCWSNVMLPDVSLRAYGKEKVVKAARMLSASVLDGICEFQDVGTVAFVSRWMMLTWRFYSGPDHCRRCIEANLISFPCPVCVSTICKRYLNCYSLCFAHRLSLAKIP